jgi:hypothetical protein
LRIRLVQKPRKGCIDGVDVDRFEVGVIYEAGSAVAALFLSEKWAVPVVSDESPVLIPLPTRTVRRIASAADSAQRRSPKKR